MKRLIVVVAALAAALLVQLTIIDGLPLPGGGAPDLVLLCVVAIGLVGGQESGLIAGFCAGLAIDLAPPATELIGQYALVFCLVGYLSGRFAFTLRRSAVLALAAAAGAAVLGEVLVGGLVVVLDTPEVTLAAVAALLPSAVVYDVVLSPVVMFVAVRIAIALGVSFNPLDDSPALETGGSARPMGLARLARLRQARHPVVGDGLGASGSWLTGDSAGGVPAVGAVGWLSGPATTRRARREQARLTAALTGAEPRKGAVWVGGRPAGLRPATGGPAAAGPSGLDKLKPDSGVAGWATREALVGPGGAGRRPASRRWRGLAQDRVRVIGRSRSGHRADRRRRRRAEDRLRLRLGHRKDLVRHRWAAWHWPARRTERTADSVRRRGPARGRPGSGAPDSEDRVRIRVAQGAAHESGPPSAAEILRVGPVCGWFVAGRLEAAIRSVRSRGSGQATVAERRRAELRRQAVTPVEDREMGQETPAVAMAAVSPAGGWPIFGGADQPADRRRAMIPASRPRLAVLSVVVFAMLAGLVVRVWYIQVKSCVRVCGPGQF